MVANIDARRVSCYAEHATVHAKYAKAPAEPLRRRYSCGEAGPIDLTANIPIGADEIEDVMNRKYKSLSTISNKQGSRRRGLIRCPNY
jgi:hypothetical protein